MKKICLLLTILSTFTLSACIINGFVKNENGEGVPDVTMILSGPKSQTVTTDETGKYQFDDDHNWLPVGTYTVTPSKDGDTFIPPSQTVTITTREWEGSDTAWPVNNVIFFVNLISEPDLDIVPIPPPEHPFNIFYYEDQDPSDTPGTSVSIVAHTDDTTLVDSHWKGEIWIEGKWHKKGRVDMNGEFTFNFEQVPNRDLLESGTIPCTINGDYHPVIDGPPFDAEQNVGLSFFYWPNTNDVLIIVEVKEGRHCYLFVCTPFAAMDEIYAAEKLFGTLIR